MAAEIRDRLLASMRVGDLAPGDRLPAERQLCQEFGVARTSVREAMQMLFSLGVIERRGNRAHVVEHLPSIDFSRLGPDGRKHTVRQLFETRRVIEMPIVELAVARATDAERRSIAELAKGFRPGMALGEFRALDRAFHAAIAEACGNELLAEVYRKVLAALFESDEFASLLYAEANRDEVAAIVVHAGEDHGAIADAFVSGDPVAGLAAVEAHLSDIEHRMIERLV